MNGLDRSAGGSLPDVSEPETSGRPPGPPPRQAANTGRLVLGVVLILLGAGWFVDTVGITDIRWTMVLPAVLAVIGVALLLTAHRGPSGGLIATGILLSAVVIATSAVAIPFTGRLSGVGDATYRPGTAAEVESGYGLGVGSLEIDLRDVPPPDEPVTVEAGVAVGQLLVRVPAGVTVDVRGRAAMGEVVVGARSQSGIGIDERQRIDGDDPEVGLVLDLSVGMGRVEVRP